ncbi:MAG: ABC transporter ATP-binding protein [Candidatus Gracilibacteria bacterium]|nr:ABC transporter ATP-binding protein [Candidatus Gracilibacteria bacterium]
MSLLAVTNWSVSYGVNKIIHNIDFHIEEGEILLLMGPNGAGKSTVLKSVFGLTPHGSGEMIYNGQSLKPSPDLMVKTGVSFVPQGNTIFSNMTIEENLRMGAYHEVNPVTVEERLEEVISFFPVLKRKRSESAFAMSGGERQILALARALMTSPKLLMLDEPSIGLAPKIVQEVFEKIQMINEEFGTAVVIVEHNLKSLLKIAHRGYILVQGKIAVEGPVEKVAQSDVLEKAFFGELA